MSKVKPLKCERDDNWKVVRSYIAPYLFIEDGDL